MDEHPSPANRPRVGSGLRFECTRCGQCCTGRPGYVWVTVEEAVKLAGFLGVSIDEFAREHLRNVQGRLSLRETPGGRCMLHDPADQRCRVYPRRPGQCRSYPFWPAVTASPESWNREAAQCPGIAEDALASSETNRAPQPSGTDRGTP